MHNSKAMERIKAEHQIERCIERISSYEAMGSLHVAEMKRRELVELYGIRRKLEGV